jgi:intein/homing endonuclease
MIHLQKILFDLNPDDLGHYLAGLIEGDGFQPRV